MTGHDSAAKSKETAQPADVNEPDPADDHTDGWVGPGGADGDGPRHNSGEGAAPSGAPVPAYDDGDSRVFLEGDG